MWGGELAPLSTKMGGFVLFAIHYGRAWYTGQSLQGLGNLGPFLFALIAGPKPHGHSHRAKVWQGIRARPWADRPKFGALSFYLTLGLIQALGLISGPKVIGSGHRHKAGSHKLGALIFSPSFGDRLAKVSFFGRAVCGGILSPPDLSALQPFNLPKVRAKKKDPI